jgi:hypothetical protein
VPGLKIFIETEAWNLPETSHEPVDRVIVVKWRRLFSYRLELTAGWCRRCVGRKRHYRKYMIYNTVSAVR